MKSEEYDNKGFPIFSLFLFFIFIFIFILFLFIFYIYFCLFAAMYKCMYTCTPHERCMYRMKYVSYTRIYVENAMFFLFVETFHF